MCACCGLLLAKAVSHAIQRQLLRSASRYHPRISHTSEHFDHAKQNIKLGIRTEPQPELNHSPFLAKRKKPSVQHVIMHVLTGQADDFDHWKVLGIQVGFQRTAHFKKAVETSIR